MNLHLAWKIWSQDWFLEHHNDTCPHITETVKDKQGQRSLQEHQHLNELLQVYSEAAVQRCS